MRQRVTDRVSSVKRSFGVSAPRESQWEWILPMASLPAPGEIFSAAAEFKAKISGRPIAIFADFYDATIGGTLLATRNTTGTDTTTGWTRLTVTTLAAPAGTKALRLSMRATIPGLEPRRRQPLCRRDHCCEGGISTGVFRRRLARVHMGWHPGLSRSLKISAVEVPSVSDTVPGTAMVSWRNGFR